MSYVCYQSFLGMTLAYCAHVALNSLDHSMERMDRLLGKGGTGVRKTRKRCSTVICFSPKLVYCVPDVCISCVLCDHNLCTGKAFLMRILLAIVSMVCWIQGMPSLGWSTLQLKPFNLQLNERIFEWFISLGLFLMISLIIENSLEN